MKRLALLLFAALAAACQPGAEPTVVRAEGVEIRATVDPETARVGDNMLQIELRDAEGRPVEDAALDVTVQMHAMGAMPAMGGAAHVAELGDGRYQAHFALEMGGTWQVDLVAQPPSGPMARAEGDTLPSHDGTNSRKTRADKAREIPLGRQGSILEITNVVDFLASDGASFLSGIDITVDGGHRAAWRGQGVISR